MSFFRWKKQINPLLALFSSLFIIIYGFVTANSINCSYFLIGLFVFYCLIGKWKTCLKMLPGLIIFGGAFFGIAYASTGTLRLSFGLLNRIAAIMLAIVPGIGTETVRMTRSLSQVHTPRAITLGMLIAMSFVPMLKGEVHRVREAMKTRGAGSILNPKIFYRAFLLPFVMRLINISDMLALSIETRGFTLSKAPYSIYVKETFSISDLFFILVILAGAVVAVIL